MIVGGRVMSFCISRRPENFIFWFRLFGRGLHFKIGEHVPLFSERYGYARVWYVLGVRIEWLGKR